MFNDLDAMFEEQRKRVKDGLNKPKLKPTLDPGGSYTLTTRGVNGGQIALDETPEELLKKSGEIGYRIGSLTFLQGS